MKGAWTGGKGSNYRKVDQKTYSDNWDKIFKQEKKDGDESSKVTEEKRETQPKPQG